MTWAIPAWLFALNRTFMAAFFQRESTPIRMLFSRDGMVQLSENMIQVLRWGLWMSPIINSFLRPHGRAHLVQPRRGRAYVARDRRRPNHVARGLSSLEHAGFHISLGLRLDPHPDLAGSHGLRVATLVNLSFLGMDRLDQRLAKFIGPAATARCIPEAVKRFTTWAPLLIPYFIPRGADWDMVWDEGGKLRSAATGMGISNMIFTMPAAEIVLLAALSVAATTALFAVIRRLRLSKTPDSQQTHTLSAPAYQVIANPNGALIGRIPDRDYDISRRSYDTLDPAGRTLFLVDMARDADASNRCWPLLGNFPPSRAAAPSIESHDDKLRISSAANGILASIDISIPGLARSRRTVDHHTAEPNRLATFLETRAVSGMGTQPARR